MSTRAVWGTRASDAREKQIWANAAYSAAIANADLSSGIVRHQPRGPFAPDAHNAEDRQEFPLASELKPAILAEL